MRSDSPAIAIRMLRFQTMMKRTINAAIGATSVAIAMFAMIFSVLVAKSEITTRETRDLLAFANRAVAQVDLVRGQAASAMQDMQAIGASPCSREYFSALGKIALNYRYVRDLGEYSEHYIQCSVVLGDVRDDPDRVRLPTSDWVASSGSEIWVAQKTMARDAHRSLLVGRDGHFVAIDPAMFVDLVDIGERSIAVVDVESGNVIASTSGADLAEMRLAYMQRDVANGGSSRYQVVPSRVFAMTIVVGTIPPLAVVGANRWLLIGWGLAGTTFGGLLGWQSFLWLRGRFSLPAALAAALKNGRLTLNYQPIVAIADRSTVGLEALLRWRYQGQNISPILIVDLAEAHGLMRALTEFVTATALKELAPILRARPEFYVSINITAPALDGETYLGQLSTFCRHWEIHPTQVRLEMTERNLIEAKGGRDAINRFRQAGFAVYIDDFGTGYSNLSYLNVFDVDALKIDKSFVDAIGRDPQLGLVVPHIISMAQSLSLEVIAEGVESASQEKYLQERGVQLAQGWLYSAALPIEELQQYLATKFV